MKRLMQPEAADIKATIVMRSAGLLVEWKNNLCERQLGIAAYALLDLSCSQDTCGNVSYKNFSILLYQIRLRFRISDSGYVAASTYTYYVVVNNDCMYDPKLGPDLMIFATTHTCMHFITHAHIL